MPDNIENAKPDSVQPTWTIREITCAAFHAAAFAVCGSAEIVSAKSVWPELLLIVSAACAANTSIGYYFLTQQLKEQAPVETPKKIRSYLEYISNKAGLKNLPEIRLSGNKRHEWYTLTSIFNRHPRIWCDDRKIKNDNLNSMTKDSLAHELAHIKLGHLHQEGVAMICLLVANCISYFVPTVPAMGGSILLTASIAGTALVDRSWCRAQEMHALRYGSMLADTREYLVHYYRKSPKRETLFERLRSDSFGVHPSYHRIMKGLKSFDKAEATTCTVKRKLLGLFR